MWDYGSSDEPSPISDESAELSGLLNNYLLTNLIYHRCDDSGDAIDCWLVRTIGLARLLLT